MRPFTYHRARSLTEALTLAGRSGSAVLAGGTTVVDLMRQDVLAPGDIVDITGLRELTGIDVHGDHIRIGALTTMADAAGHDTVRSDFPALAQSLTQAASQQLRNVATVGGNVLQRTRCPYFRDGHSACNKRAPGTGCSAHEVGHPRNRAVLGASPHCAAVYAGDWAVALAAFDAELELLSARGSRRVAVESFHREPGSTPAVENILEPDELVGSIIVPRCAAAKHSCYRKVRDRASFAFAIASAAVGVDTDGDIDGGIVTAANIAVGGTATRPWRCRAAEHSLVGRPLTDAGIRHAAELAYLSARGPRVRIDIGVRTVVAALRDLRRTGTP
ncbi:oxidoreductase, molybdopterin-binding [Mycolicibacterium canariasense]|uniref:Oxidoreductase, molybdopterin-binding n=1 Tax=Mycolicibacterium canariasense TaxID=228230 RepID=A0A100WIY3_MYCCR|nr:xanthine dehydrogenase family protein subunit M [Mycolicibacterium canariasense]MCV7208080.1 xanthine dehydrogenase family protein subunit M [Mycolicibacterium canariasense]ORV09570.1 hypothetical protein AWB94_09995 [Mycolicibacterium canariasense]GAS99177.1 oxidoreductase, molybdopterin-binding [Mycolicibacterium canariasense]